MFVLKIAITICVGCFLLITNASAATLYACMEEKSVGMKASEGYRTANFSVERFTAKIDKAKPSVEAKKIWIEPFNSECLFSAGREEFTCATGWGSTFTFNLETNDFVRSYNATVSDDPFVSRGSCETF